LKIGEKNRDNNAVKKKKRNFLRKFRVEFAGSLAHFSKFARGFLSPHHKVAGLWAIVFLWSHLRLKHHVNPYLFVEQVL